MKLYKKIIERGFDFDDVEITILQNYPCNDKKDLRRCEGVYQRELEPTLNTDIAGRTPKEYREDNKDYYLQYQQGYRQNNKESIREWRENNKDNIQTKNSEKTECKYCNKQMSKSSTYRHYKTCPNRPSSSS